MKKQVSKIVNEWEQELKDNPFISVEAEKMISDFRKGVREDDKELEDFLKKGIKK